MPAVTILRPCGHALAGCGFEALEDGSGPVGSYAKLRDRDGSQRNKRDSRCDMTIVCAEDRD